MVYNQPKPIVLVKWWLLNNEWFMIWLLIGSSFVIFLQKVNEKIDGLSLQEHVHIKRQQIVVVRIIQFNGLLGKWYFLALIVSLIFILLLQVLTLKGWIDTSKSCLCWIWHVAVKIWGRRFEIKNWMFTLYFNILWLQYILQT